MAQILPLLRKTWWTVKKRPFAAIFHFVVLPLVFGLLVLVCGLFPKPISKVLSHFEQKVDIRPTTYDFGTEPFDGERELEMAELVHNLVHNRKRIYVVKGQGVPFLGSQIGRSENGLLGKYPKSDMIDLQAEAYKSSPHKILEIREDEIPAVCGKKNLEVILKIDEYNKADFHIKATIYTDDAVRIDFKDDQENEQEEQSTKSFSASKLILAQFGSGIMNSIFSGVPTMMLFCRFQEMFMKETADIKVTHKVRRLKSADAEDNKLAFLFMLLFLLPLSQVSGFFMEQTFREKQSKIIGMMRLNGLKWRSYIFSQFVSYYLGYLSMFAVLTVCSMPLFRLFSVNFALFFIYGAFCLSMSQFSRILLLNAVCSTRKRLEIIQTILLLALVISIALSVSGTKSTLLGFGRFILILYPDSIVYDWIYSLSSKTEIPIGQLLSQLSYPMIISLLVPLLYILLGYYLLQVLPQGGDSGASKKWNFFIPRKQKRIENLEEKDVESDMAQDVLQEYRRVQQNPKDILLVNRLGKRYGDKVALQSVSFGVSKNSVFALLGPNGAGKTTLMKAITGLVNPTSGYCTIDGFDCQADMEKVYKLLGFCPQHDIFFPSLTAYQHLYFYCELKSQTGNRNEIEKKVKKLLKMVHLTQLQDNHPSELSGGEQRRLSIAISLCGDSKVVFLDEPTTGLDPEIRKMIWNIILTIKKKSIVILSTHSMEEAETLSDSLTIMTRGSLRCLGTPLSLREKYGGNITITATVTDQKRAIKFFQKLLPEIKVSYQSDNFIKLLYPGLVKEICAVYDVVSRKKERYGILHWGISQPSLEQVFINIVRSEEVEA